MVLCPVVPTCLVTKLCQHTSVQDSDTKVHTQSSMKKYLSCMESGYLSTSFSPHPFNNSGLIKGMYTVRFVINND